MLKIEKRMYSLSHVTGMVEEIPDTLKIVVAGFSQALPIYGSNNWIPIKNQIENYWKRQSIDSTHIVELQLKIKELELAIIELQSQLLYIPGGSEYKKAETHFNSLDKK